MQVAIIDFAIHHQIHKYTKYILQQLADQEISYYTFLFLIVKIIICYYISPFQGKPPKQPCSPQKGFMMTSIIP